MSDEEWPAFGLSLPRSPSNKPLQQPKACQLSVDGQRVGARGSSDASVAAARPDSATIDVPVRPSLLNGKSLIWNDLATEMMTVRILFCSVSSLS